MSSMGFFLLRGRSALDAHRYLAGRDGWSLLDESVPLAKLAKQAPTSQPAIVLPIPDYFPDDAGELELYRDRLIAAFPLADLARLHDDPRGVLVFDPMVAEEHEASTYDEVVAACSKQGYGGLFFDPARPIEEQNLPFEELEVEVIDLKDFVFVDDEPSGMKKAKTTSKPKKKTKAKKTKATPRKAAVKTQARNPKTKKAVRPTKSKAKAKARTPRRARK